ncbi:MAG: hypothetical protein DRI80_18140, partial [Chloroflexota bacterium]
MMTEHQEATGQEDARPSRSPSGDAASVISPSPDRPYRFNAGDLIAGRYEVIAPLGRGGFAEVYRCRDVTLGRDMTVKVLTETGSGLEEARAAARFKHPNIGQVYDVFPPKEGDSGLHFIVFDYVAGKTLEAHLNAAQYRRLELDEKSLRIIRQVSEALDYAHGQGVIHRDIKPSNIILDDEGDAYLTDFGLAKVKQSDGLSMHSEHIERRLGGTIPYMAPEQLKEGKPGDERSDLYSLGVVVYEMLTGQLPFRGRDTGMIVQIATGDPLPPTLANPGLPKGIEPVLLRALDKSPENRYPSCLAFAEELKKAVQAYVDANAYYSQALELITAKRWRQALAAFEDLERKAPGFKDAPHYLEQARHQVRLLKLYEQAQEALQQEKFQDALDTLNILTDLAPDYDVAGLRKQAQEGLAQEEKRSLDEQYRQAVQQFENEEYRACLDTLAVIRERDPSYPDPEGIEADARTKVERQQRLHTLYTQGVEQMSQEQWEKAIATFQTLRQEAPGYEDVETRLTMARHLERLSSFLQEARGFLEQGDFAACVDKLGELQRVDANYKRDEVDGLRREALNRLHERAKHLIQEGKFEESLDALAELQERSRSSEDYPDVKELEAQAREGIRRRELRAELDELYRRAVERLEQRGYAQALELWQTIQRQKGSLDYPDPRDVAARAREGLCASLVNQALVALAQKDPRRALELWDRIREVDPRYHDSLRIEQQARAMIEQQEKTWKLLRWAIPVGGVIALFCLIALVVGGGSLLPGLFGPRPTETVVLPTPTRTPSPTPE